MTRDERTRASAGAGFDAGSGSTARGNVSARWYTLDDRRRVQVATAGDRLVARVVDWGLLCIVGVAMLLLAGALSDDWEIEVVLVSIHLCVVLVGVLYEWILIATRGHTIGKFVAGVTVRRAADGGVPGWKPAILRLAIPTVVAAGPAVVGLWLRLAGFSGSANVSLLLLGALGGVVCYLSSIWARDRRGWHDRVAGTVVVATDRAHRGTRLAIAGLALALVALVSEVAIAAAVAQDPGAWLNGGWIPLGELVVFLFLLPVNVACWIGAVIFSTVAYRRARTAHLPCRAAAFAARTRGEAAPPRPDCWHVTCQVVATVGLCAALAGMIFLTHLINLVT